MNNRYTLIGIGGCLETAPTYNSLLALTDDLKLLVDTCCSSGDMSLVELLKTGCGMFYSVLLDCENVGLDELDHLLYKEREAIVVEYFKNHYKYEPVLKYDCDIKGDINEI